MLLTHALAFAALWSLPTQSLMKSARRGSASSPYISAHESRMWCLRGCMFGVCRLGWESVFIKFAIIRWNPALALAQSEASRLDSAVQRQTLPAPTPHLHAST